MASLLPPPARRGRGYAEIEINPQNVVCDVLVRELTPTRDIDLAWNFTGLETAVRPMTAPGGAAIGWTVSGARETIDCDDNYAFCSDRYD